MLDSNPVKRLVGSSGEFGKLREMACAIASSVSGVVLVAQRNEADGSVNGGDGVDCDCGRGLG